MDDDLIPDRLQEMLDDLGPTAGANSAGPTRTVLEHFEDRASNRDFLERYAAAGRVGLVCGSSLIDQVIQKATGKASTRSRQGEWSHAWIFQGRRRDGHHWIIESDLEAGLKHNRLGVQENRVSKFLDEQACPRLAILDFGLSAEQVDAVLAEALDLVANQATYSLMEILGTAVALNIGRDRKRKNLLAKKKSMYCSGLVQHVFAKAGLNLIPGVHSSMGTPEELARSPLIKQAYWLRRGVDWR
jgi:hypothetical protein